MPAGKPHEGFVNLATRGVVLVRNCGGERTGRFHELHII